MALLLVVVAVVAATAVVVVAAVAVVAVVATVAVDLSVVVAVVLLLAVLSAVAVALLMLSTYVTLGEIMRPSRLCTRSQNHIMGLKVTPLTLSLYIFTHLYAPRIYSPALMMLLISTLEDYRPRYFLIY